jgi:hypothetical protein
MFNTIVEAGAVGAGARAALRYGSVSDQMMRLLAATALQHWIQRPLEKLEHWRGCLAFGDWLFGEWSFEKWSHSENGRILAVPRIGRSEIGRSENGRSEIGRSENGRSENGRCTSLTHRINQGQG